MKIKKVEIEAFRAYRAKSDGTFNFTNEGDVPSNFVALYAPNGFGKSSFYDAIEWAVTNHLTRLSDYNKSNNEIAAKATKDPNQAQKILRNNFADTTSVTKVSVSTTLPMIFERELPTPKKNQKDIRIGDNSRKENDFFKRVILSQDEIDRFLRETNPQDRYIKFIESFGGDLEQARKELWVFITDIDAEVKNLEKRQKKLIDIISQPLDLTSIKQFNTIASELNLMGESISIANENISSQNDYQLKANLVSRQHELNTENQNNVRKLELLINSLGKIPKIELDTKNLIEQKKQFSRLEKGVADAERYQILLDSYNKCTEEHKNLYTYQISFNEVADRIDAFLETNKILQELSLKQENLIKERSKNSAEITFDENNLIKLEQEIKTVENRILFLKNSLNNAGSIYLNISNHRAKINDLKAKISDQVNLIQKDQNLFNDLNSKLNTISSLKITSDLLLSKNLGHFYFDQNKIEELMRCKADLNLIAMHNHTILATQKALSEQMELQEQLIAIGIDYLSIHSSNICPLCTVPHPSPDVLLSKIKSQNLLSELSQENSRKLSESSIREKELYATIEDITQRAIEAQVQQLNTLHKALNEVNDRFTKAEQDKSYLETECKNLENIVLQLEQSVWDLSHEDLIARADAEIKELTVKSSILREKHIDLKNKIILLTDSVKAQDTEVQHIASTINMKRNEYGYIKVLAYINENAVSVSDLRNHCELKRNEINSQLFEYGAKKEVLKSKYNDLNKEMLADGTWMDFAELKLQKENLEVNIAKINFEINAYYQNLSEVITVRPEYPLEKIKTLVNTEIEDCKDRVQEIETRLNRINLLLELIVSFTPYINRISMQKELVTIKKDLKKLRTVREALNVEMQEIVSSLKELINNFFYEELINSIYKKIDPHPDFKKVVFQVNFDSFDKPCLNIVMRDETGLIISPILYFSAAQSNILSLSVFLANALHAKDDDGKPVDVILIDDPIQSMDSINILSTIDLLRSICIQFNKQIIISTHDENFFKLLQRKIPSQIFGSKFLQLEKYGVAVPVDPFYS
ncbi:hypothetical protein [uncultured Acinetobacter sp.]|uniref:hypothetical protein n=1 Tax=uncultured Acinetobacter sp. TaxID=165433 RepID=UPI002634DDEC|nr:hypothetical protein [uncultured Acinetobacter sp.]